MQLVHVPNEGTLAYNYIKDWRPPGINFNVTEKILQERHGSSHYSATYYIVTMNAIQSYKNLQNFITLCFSAVFSG